MHRYAADDAPKLAALNLKTTRQRRERIESVAAKSGRSLTAEVERLLDLALDHEERMGGEALSGAMSLIGQAAGRVLQESGRSLANVKTRAQVVAAIKVATDWVLPAITGAEASEDYELLERAVAVLNVTLPRIVDDFDPTSLAYLAQGRPLPERQWERYLGAIRAAQLHFSEDKDAVSVLVEAENYLRDAQRAACRIQDLVLEQSPIGESRARRAILNMISEQYPVSVGELSAQPR